MSENSKSDDIVSLIQRSNVLIKLAEKRITESKDPQSLLEKLIKDELERAKSRDADTLDGLHAEEIIRRGRMGGGGSPSTQSPTYVLYLSGARYYAKSMVPGLSDYSDADPGVVIQAAIEAVKSVGGGTLYFRNGVYTINTENMAVMGGIGINDASNVELEGESWGAIIQQAAGQDWEPLIEVANSNNIRFRNLTIYSRSITATGDCIDCDHSNHIQVDHCYLRTNDTSSDCGISFHADTADVVGLEVNNCRFNIHGKAIRIIRSGAFTVRYIKIIGNWFEANSAISGTMNAAVDLGDGSASGAYEVMICNNMFAGGTINNDCVIANGVRQMLIDGNDCVIGADGFHLDGCYRVLVQNNIFQGGVGVRLVNATGTEVIQDNYFYGSTQIGGVSGGVVQGNMGQVGWYQSADYGAGWVNWLANITGTPLNGTICVFHNTNGAGANRLGCYANGAWHYVDLT